MARETQDPAPPCHAIHFGEFHRRLLLGWLALVKPGACLCLKGLISVQEIKFVTCHFIRRGSLVLDPGEAPSTGPCPTGQPG